MGVSPRPRQPRSDKHSQSPVEHPLIRAGGVSTIVTTNQSAPSWGPDQKPTNGCGLRALRFADWLQ